MSLLLWFCLFQTPNVIRDDDIQHHHHNDDPTSPSSWWRRSPRPPPTKPWSSFCCRRPRDLLLPVFMTSLYHYMQHACYVVALSFLHGWWAFKTFLFYFLFFIFCQKRGGVFCNNISSSVLHLETRLFLQKDNISIIEDKVSNHNISKNLKHYEILNVLRTLVSLCAKPVCTDISQCKNHQPSFWAAAIAFGNKCIYCVVSWGRGSSLLSLSRQPPSIETQ